jgi:hypothetical protein
VSARGVIVKRALTGFTLATTIAASACGGVHPEY